MNPPRYAATPGGRFSWQDFGQTDADEVLVYDRAEALTHLIDGLAMDIHHVLQSHPQGLTARDITTALEGGTGEATFANDITLGEETVVAGILKLMLSIGMVARVPADAGG